MCVCVCVCVCACRMESEVASIDVCVFDPPHTLSNISPMSKSRGRWGLLGGGARKKSPVWRPSSYSYLEEGMMYKSENSRLNLRRSWRKVHSRSYSTRIHI